MLRYLFGFRGDDAAIGEELTLDLAGAGHLVTCRVRVRESRPVILEGRVRHRMRLEVLERSRRPEVAGSVGLSA